MKHCLDLTQFECCRVYLFAVTAGVTVPVLEVLAAHGKVMTTVAWTVIAPGFPRYVER